MSLMWLVLLYFLPVAVSAADNLDSLKQVYLDAKIDTIKYQALLKYEQAVKRSDRAAALPIMKERLDLAKRIKVGPDLMAKVNLTIANNFMYLGENDSSLIYMTRAADWSEVSGDMNLVSATMGNLALLYQGLNEFEDAIQTYHRAISFAQEYEDVFGEVSASVNLGSLLMNQKDYNRALEYLEEMEKRVRELSIDNEPQIEEVKPFFTAIYINLGQAYMAQKRDSLANINFIKAKDFLINLQDDYSKTYYDSFIEYSLAEIQVLKCTESFKCSNAEWLELLKSGEKAALGFRSIEYTDGIGVALNLIGRTLSGLSRLDEARDTLLAALAISVELNTLDEQVKNYNALSANSRIEGDYEEAFSFLKKANEISEELRNTDRDRFYTEQEKKFETYETKIDLAEMSASKEKGDRLRIQQMFGFAFAIMLLSIGGFIFYSRYKLSKERELTSFQKSVNTAMARFVPTAFIKALGRDEITDVQLGDQVEKEVTVMFSDIRDFTTISESMTPKENFQLVSEYAGRMGPIVEEYGGFVNQYMGDGILAIFDSGPSQALRSCIAMQEEIKVFNMELDQRGIKPLKVGMGLHKGPLIMGIIGDDKRRDATLISDAVNTAARIESTTKLYDSDILISKDIEEELINRDDYRLESVGDVQVKGKLEKIQVFAVYH